MTYKILRYGRLWNRYFSGWIILSGLLLVGLYPDSTLAQQRSPVNQLHEVGYWSFEDNLEDASASELDGTLMINGGGPTTPAFVPGKVTGTKALLLDGDVFVDVQDIQPSSPLNFQYNQPFSVSVWVRRLQENVKIVLMGKMDTPSGPGWALFFEDENNDLYFNFRHESGGQRVKVKTENVTIPADTYLTDDFYHIVMTYDGSGEHTGAHLYVNRTEDTHLDHTGLSTSTLTNVSFNIGARDHNESGGTNDGNDHPFYGHVDEVRIFEGELLSIDIECLNELPIDCKPGDLYWNHGLWGQDWQ